MTQAKNVIGESGGVGVTLFDPQIGFVTLLTALGVGFFSMSEALDLTTPSGRALAGMRPCLRNSNGIFCGTESRRESIKRERTGTAWAANDRR